MVSFSNCWTPGLYRLVPLTDAHQHPHWRPHNCSKCNIFQEQESAKKGCTSAPASSLPCKHSCTHVTYYACSPAWQAAKPPGFSDARPPAWAFLAGGDLQGLVPTGVLSKFQAWALPHLVQLHDQCCMSASACSSRPAQSCLLLTLACLLHSSLAQLRGCWLQTRPHSSAPPQHNRE